MGTIGDEMAIDDLRQLALEAAQARSLAAAVGTEGRRHPATLWLHRRV